jgi:hypothetical protein
MKNLLADIPISNDGFKGPGTGPLSDVSSPEQTLPKVISTSVGLITAIAFIYFTFNIFIGAFNIITAGSDKAQVEAARKKITNSIIGVIVTISAIFIIGLIGNVLGIDFLNLTSLIDLLSK